MKQAPPDLIVRQFDLRAIFRLVAWGGGAALALTLCVLSIWSDAGTRRLAAAYSTTQVVQENTNSLARQQAADDTRRLSEVTRSLAADRDRLLARVTVLERNLEDVTGSIGRAREPKAEANPAPTPEKNSTAEISGPTALSTAMTTAAAAPASPPLPLRRPATIVVPPRATPPFAAAAPQAAPVAPPADAETTQSVATTSEFGVDIGGGANMDALRDLWGAARTNHGTALQGLRPVIAVRDGDKGVELRLIAGPLANAGAAAKICAALAAGGWACKPTVFDGQKLAVR